MTENLLARLLQHFWVNDSGGLEWNWKEGVGLNEYDPKLNSELLEWAKNAPAVVSTEINP